MIYLFTTFTVPLQDKHTKTTNVMVGYNYTVTKNQSLFYTLGQLL